MSDEYSNVVDFYEIDCTKEDAIDLCKGDFEVEGFPTLVYFPNEKEFSGIYVQFDEVEREY